MRRFAAALLMLGACSFEHGQLGQPRDGRDDDARPLDGPPSDGIPPEGLPVWSDIVIEAEAYTTKVDDSMYVWSEFNTTAGYSGTGYMQIPGNGALCTAQDIATGCAQLRYAFSIAATGTYYVHARMLGMGTADNSVYWGRNGVVEASPFQPTADGTWRWVSSGNLTISAGTHFLDIWHREAGTRVDVVAVTMTSTPPP